GNFTGKRVLAAVACREGLFIPFFSMMKGDLAEKKSSRGREQVPLGLALSSAPGVVSIDATYGIGCAGASCI
ncbi:hypothetical protein, partial [Akkermansia sp.]|uniref:hypothetical protein n=1 Tax=Akkermansia sp. TaxID=1872421 RepID=UPI003AB53F3B